MSAAASMLLPGGGMIQGVIEKMSDQIVAMVDEILSEKADAMMYEIIQPKIDECLKTIFESNPVQMEASKMFNREIFPIYKQTLDDFANFNTIVQNTNKEIDNALEKYTKTIIEDASQKDTAKQTLIKSLKTINETKIGTMKGGDIKTFLGDEENRFKIMDGGKPKPAYLSDSNKKISEAIEEIVGNAKKEYDEKRKQIKESEETFAKFTDTRRKEMRIPGMSACTGIEHMKQEEDRIEENKKDSQIESLKKKLEDATQTENKTQKISGGKKRRQRRKKTHRKRR